MYGFAAVKFRLRRLPSRPILAARRPERPASGGGPVQGRLSSVWLNNYIRERGGVLTVERRTVVAG